MIELEYLNEQELRNLMNSVCRRVEAGFAECGVEKPFFCIVVFNDPKVAQYAANCTRDSMIQAMRETADRLAGNQDVKR